MLVEYLCELEILRTWHVLHTNPLKEHICPGPNQCTNIWFMDAIAMILAHIVVSHIGVRHDNWKVWHPKQWLQHILTKMASSNQGILIYTIKKQTRGRHGWINNLRPSINVFQRVTDFMTSSRLDPTNEGTESINCLLKQILPTNNHVDPGAMVNGV